MASNFYSKQKKKLKIKQKINTINSKSFSSHKLKSILFSMSTNTNKNVEPTSDNNNDNTNNIKMYVREGKPMVFKRIGSPYDFLYKDFVPGRLNHIKNPILKMPGSTFGTVPNHPINLSNPLRKMNHPYVKHVKKTARFYGNIHKDPKLAELFKHLQETATEVKVDGDETTYITESMVVDEGDRTSNTLEETLKTLNLDQRPARMIKLDESTSKKVGV